MTSYSTEQDADPDMFDPTESAPKPRDRARSVSAASQSASSTRLSRLLREAGWILFLALAFYLGLILATHSSSDPGYFFSGVVSGNGGGNAVIANKGGVTGA